MASSGLRVLIFTPWFWPHLGGVETVADLVATGLCGQGCEVSVITTFPAGQAARERPYPVQRGGSAGSWWRAVQAADVVLMLGPSLRFIWMPLLQRKPLVVNHYTWTPWGRRPLVSLAQRALTRLACNVTPSRMLADSLGGGTQVMPNPYDERVFHEYEGVARDRDLVFLGRLVEEKGLPVLLRALHDLRRTGDEATLTVIGSGPDEQRLKTLAAELGLEARITWRGPVSGEALARELAAHRVLVVPSRWREPFGIVAVEGLACGCSVVVSDHGALLEAGGPGAIPFSAGDPGALAQAIVRARQRPCLPGDAAQREAHLAQYRIDAVAARYVELFGALLQPREHAHG